MAEVSQTTRRTVLQYHFEGNAAVYVDVVGDVHPRAVLWALRETMAVKERELERKDCTDGA